MENSQSLEYRGTQVFFILRFFSFQECRYVYEPHYHDLIQDKKNYPEAPYVPVIEILHTKDYVKDLFGKNYATKDPENPEKQEDALI